MRLKDLSKSVRKWAYLMNSPEIATAKRIDALNEYIETNLTEPENLLRRVKTQLSKVGMN